MSYNIPLNLVGFAALASQSHSLAQPTPETPSVLRIQPTSAGSRSSSASGNGRNGAPLNWPQAPQKQLPVLTTPDTATPKSIVNAQTKDNGKTNTAVTPQMLFKNAATSTKVDAGSRPRMVDRYAPPDPLPTAPILKDRVPAVPTPKPV